MENTLEKPYYIKFKALIILLAIASMLFMVGYHATCLFTYEYTYGFYEDSYALRFQLPTVSDFIYIGLSLLPYLLIVVYVAVSGNGRRATVLLPIALLLVTLAFFQQDILTQIESYCKYLEDALAYNLEYIGRNFSRLTNDEDYLFRMVLQNIAYLEDLNNPLAHRTRYHFYTCLENSPLILALILAAVSAFRGWRSKVCITMASTAGLLYVVKYYTLWMKEGLPHYYLEEALYLNVIRQPLLLLALFTGFLALFVLGVKSNLKPVFRARQIPEEDVHVAIPGECVAEPCEFEEEPAEEAAPIEEAAPEEEAAPVEEAAPAEEADPVKELKLLECKLELGLISEEDYRKQQKELIEKL